MKVKISSLKVAELDKLLLARSLPRTGNKSEKIARLMACNGNDEVEVEDSESQEDFHGFDEAETGDDSLTSQMRELKDIMLTLARSVQQLTTLSTERAITSNAGLNSRDTEQQVPAEVISRQSGSGTSGCLKDYIVMIPDFDPIKGNVTSVQFIDKVETLQRLHGWSDETTLFAVHHKMSGVAKMWIDALPVVETWKEFRQQFLKDFPSRVSVADIHRELIARKRNSNESLVEYYYAMLAIGKRGSVDEASILSYIINGLNDSSLTRTLLAMNPQTCSELLRSLENLTIQTYARKQTKNDEDDKTASVSGGAPTKGVKCFNCNRFGHISTSCPQPLKKPKCSKCAKIGHDASQCKGKGTTVAAMTEESKDYCPPVMKDVTVNGKTYEGFVDTGSDFTLMRKAVVPEGCDMEVTSKRMKGFGGSIVEVVEMFETNVVIDEESLMTTIYVVPNDLMRYDVLLGRDVLCKKQTKLTIEHGVLKVKSTMPSTFNVGESLDEHQKEKLDQILSSFKDCFAETLEDLGRCKNTQMEISLSTDKPVVGKRYQVPFSQRQILSDIIDKLLRCCIIRPSDSPYAASVLLVKKANGESRMCTDYRALNEVTIKKQYSMPVVEEQLSLLSGNKYFTTLDMTSGYYQIHVKEESKKFTAFITPDGLYEYNVMPFGLTNAPMVFQEMITQIIRKLKHRRNIISYVDEVIIPSLTISEGLQVLEEFLTAIREEGLTLRPTKCSFLQESVSFLGHTVSANGIRPGEEKTKCIEEFPRPESVSDVRKFIGITNFFRKFVPKYSQIAMPLTRLMKKDAVFIWKEPEENSFITLKTRITTQPVLALFDPNKEHEVHTDASSIGLSGVLLQYEGEELRPVFYYSRRCTESEGKYASHELEVLAIVETLERFRIYLLGKCFNIVTDCNSIATTKATSPLPPRIARWWFKLQEFDFTITHRSGAKMTHVDGMSRSPTLPSSQSRTVAENVLALTTNINDWVYQLQMSDKKLKHIFEVLNGNLQNEANEIKQIKADYVIENGRLFRKVNNMKRMVIPERVRWRITKACHDDLGHFGEEKTLQRLQRDFWFPRMRRYVKSYIQSCPECCYNKVKGGKAEGELHIEEVLPIPFRSINIDHMGPFPKSKKGNQYVFLIVCSFSKYTIIKPTRNTKTAPVITALREVMSIFGQPRRIVSDKGTAFTSKEFQQFVEYNGIQHVQTAVRTPRANGQAERINQTVLNALKCLVGDTKEWDTETTTIQWSINSQLNATTKFSPNDLIFNFSLRDVSYNRIIQAVGDEERENFDVRVIQQQAVANIQKQKEKWKARFDSRHSKPTQYKEGDLVVIDTVPQPTGESHKLDARYKGPYIVTKIIGNDRYLVEDLPDLSLKQRKYCGVMSTDHMKPWCYGDPSLEIEDKDESDDGSPRRDEESGEAELSTIKMSL